MIDTLWYPMAQAALKQQGYEDTGDGQKFVNRKKKRLVDLSQYQDVKSFMADMKESVADIFIVAVLNEAY